MKEGILEIYALLTLSLCFPCEAYDLIKDKCKDVKIQTKDDKIIDIIWAASRNNIDMVKMLMENGANVKVQSSSILLAARNNNMEMVKKLIGNDADVNIQPQYVESALIKAASHNNIEMVKMLIDNHADVNVHLSYVESALIKAARNNNFEMVKMLIQNNADVNEHPSYVESALIKAASNNNIEMVKMLIDKNADVNVHPSYGQTALIKAASHNNIEMVKMLIENNADVNEHPSYVESALIKAASNNNIEMVKMLIDKNADVNVHPSYGQTALIKAASNNNIEMVKMLIDNNADVNVHPSYVESALIKAASNNNIEMVKMLIDNNADVNVHHSCVDSALIKAASNNNMEMVKILIENDADVNAQTGNGKTAIFWATHHNNMEMVIILYENSIEQPENVGEYVKHCRDKKGWLKKIIETDNIEKLKSVWAFYYATKKTEALQGILLLGAAKGSKKMCEFLMEQGLPSTTGRIDTNLSKCLFGDKEPHHVSALSVAVHFKKIENIELLLQLAKDSDIEMIEQQQEEVETFILKEIRKRMESKFKDGTLGVEAGFRNGRSILVVYTDSWKFNPFDEREDSFCGRSFLVRNPQIIRNQNQNLYGRSVNLSDAQIEIGEQIINDNAPYLWSHHSNLNIITMRASNEQDTQFDNGNFYILLFCKSKGIIPLGQNEFPTTLSTHDNKHSLPVHVEEGFFELCPSYYTSHSRDFHQHLKMGCSISTSTDTKSGTLGPFVEINGQPGFLTCSHVLFDIKQSFIDYDYDPSDAVDVFQPEIGTLSQTHPRLYPSRTPCGTVVKAVFNPNLEYSVDVAAVKITDKSRKPEKGHFAVDSKENYQQIGFDDLPNFNSGRHKDPKDMSTKGMMMKCGKMTHLTRGFAKCTGTQVRDIVTPGTSDGVTVVMKNQIEVVGMANDPFFIRGDSGSAVFQVNEDDSLDCIGMAIGSTSYNSAIVTPISAILQALGPDYSLKRF